MLLASLALGYLGRSNYLRGLIDSDRALARTARLKGMKWTYERTFSADALVLTSKVQKAADWLSSQDNKLTDRRFWDVNRAEISAQGEFGYTAGAWTMLSGKTYTNGDYVRVWKKAHKDWKLVFEADTSTDLPTVPTGKVAVPLRPKGKTKQEPPATDDVEKAISEIESKLGTDGATSGAYLEDAYLLRPGLPPTVGYTEELTTTGMKPKDERFIVDRPADLACSFGSLDSDTDKWPFLRVWRHSLKKGWQITLEYVGKLNPATKE